jgi:hypothetical protein
MESDWRKFREMVPHLRERFLRESNSRLIQLLSAPGKTETERFWVAEEEARKLARILRECLDGHSRSRMTDFLLRMRSVGMIQPEDLRDCSLELQREIFH